MMVNKYLVCLFIRVFFFFCVVLVLGSWVFEVFGREARIRAGGDLKSYWGK